MTEEERPLVVRKKGLTGEVFRPVTFEGLGKLIATGYAAGLVTVIDGKAHAIEKGEGGNDETGCKGLD